MGLELEGYIGLEVWVLMFPQVTCRPMSNELQFKMFGSLWAVVGFNVSFGEASFSTSFHLEM